MEIAAAIFASIAAAALWFWNRATARAAKAEQEEQDAYLAAQYISLQAEKAAAARTDSDVVISLRDKAEARRLNPKK